MVLSTFKIFLNEDKNKHLDHIEDSILLDGASGARESIYFLTSLKDMLSTISKKNLKLSTKFDGAPAVIFGTNPENGKFFVGTKGVFSKARKLLYTDSDVDKLYSGDLAKKLKLSLSTLEKITPSGRVFQGDFLYAKSDIAKNAIDGKTFLTFTPNTITYAIPVDSELAKTIETSKLGIVVHTEYIGKTIDDLNAVFNPNISDFKSSKDVWLCEATYKDVTGKATLTAEESKELDSIISEIGKKFHSINGNFLKELSANEPLRLFIMTWNNLAVRSGRKIDPKTHAKDIVEYIKERYSIEISKLSKDSAKEKRMILRNNIIEYLSSNIDNLENVLYLQELIVKAKNIILDKLEQVQSLNTFLKTDTGYKVTSPEGFVAINLDGDAVKLVDRLEFSHANFTAAKNWSK